MSPTPHYPRSVLLAKDVEAAWKRHKRAYPKVSFNALVNDLLVQFFRTRALPPLTEGLTKEQP